MSSPLIVRGNYGDLFSSTALPVLEEIFNHTLMLQPNIREKLAKVVPTERDIYQMSEMTDFQNFVEVPEGTDYTLTRPKQGLNTTLVIKKYGLGFSISEEAMEDGKFEFISDAVRKLAESAVETQELSVINLYNNAFSGTLTWDGVSLCNTTHTLPSGLTFRNKASTDADLSPSSLDNALTDFATQFVRDSGKISNIRPVTLLVPEQLRRYAMELVGSDLRADTADNNMNSLKSAGLNVEVSPRLTDSNSWFLQAAPAETGMRIISRKGIETKAAGPDVGFINDSIIYKSRFREIVAATHAYGLWGSSGAS